MRRNYSYLRIVTVVILIVIICTACARSKSKELHYKDKFPDNINLFSSSDKKLKISDIQNKNKMIFYLNSKSSDCLQRLSAISKIMKVYNYENISFLLLWEDSIPFETVKKYEIDLNTNYTLKTQATLSKSAPDGFLLDENNEVMRVTGYEYIDAIKDIISLRNDPNLVTQINEDIIQDAFGTATVGVDKDKPTLLLFLTASCKLCKETEEKININSAMLQNKVNVITLRPDFENRQEYDINYITDYSLVYYNVYDKLYNSKQFPFFVVLDKNKQVQENFSDTNEMINYVKNLK